MTSAKQILNTYRLAGLKMRILSLNDCAADLGPDGLRCQIAELAAMVRRPDEELARELETLGLAVR